MGSIEFGCGGNGRRRYEVQYFFYFTLLRRRNEGFDCRVIVRASPICASSGGVEHIDLHEVLLMQLGAHCRN